MICVISVFSCANSVSETDLGATRESNRRKQAVRTGRQLRGDTERDCRGRCDRHFVIQDLKLRAAEATAKRLSTSFCDPPRPRVII